MGISKFHDIYIMMIYWFFLEGGGLRLIFEYFIINLKTF